MWRMLENGNTQKEGEGSVANGVILEHRIPDFGEVGSRQSFFWEFLNPGVPSYSLKAFNFPPRNRVGEHRRLEQVLSNLSFPLNHLGWCKDVGV